MELKLRTNKIRIIGLVSLGLVIGIAAGLSNFMVHLCFILTGFTIVVIGLFLMIYQFIRNKVISNNGLRILLVSCVSAVSMVGSIYGKENWMMHQADSLIKDIENYQTNTGTVPENLEILRKENNWLHYNPDTSLKSFSLFYSINGWDKMHYNSVEAYWIRTD